MKVVFKISENGGKSEAAKATTTTTTSTTAKTTTTTTLKMRRTRPRSDVDVDSELRFSGFELRQPPKHDPTFYSAVKQDDTDDDSDDDDDYDGVPKRGYEQESNLQNSISAENFSDKY
jgi:hypothetical protein